MNALHALGDWVRTSVLAEIRGTNPAQFLNLCAKNSIEVWGIEYRDENSLCVRLHARDFRACAALLRKSACRARILKKAGLHYALKKACAHWVLLVLLAAFGALCAVLNTRVLSFSFTGYETVPPRRILSVLSENGLSFGARKADVDASDLRNAVLSEIPELIWFTVTFHGSAAHVDVRERTPVPAVADWDACADVVSDHYGVVRDVSVSRGRAQVKEGDLVVPGKVLISGVSPLRIGERSLFLHAQGKVLADVWYKTTLATPLEVLSKTPTGRRTVRWALVIGKNRIDFYKKDGNGFDTYDKIIKKYALSIADGFSLPVTLIREELVEYESCFSRRDAALCADALTDAAARRTQGLDTGVEPGETAARRTEQVLYAYAYGVCTRYIGIDRIR